MVLVTGGTGFLGRHVVAALVTAGHDVRVLSRRPLSPELAGGRASGAEGDLEDAASLERALADVDVVVHLAALLERPGLAPEAITRVNVGGTRALARAARAARVSRFVHVSSAGVYGDGDDAAPRTEGSALRPATRYEVSKLAGERALAQELDGSRVAWAVLRPAGIYGPGRQGTLAFFRNVERRRLWLHGPASVIVHPTYVGDVVQGIALTLEKGLPPGDTLNLAGSRALPFRELIDLVAARLGVRVTQRALPGVVARAIVVPLALALRALGRPAPALFTRLGRRVVNRAVDTSKARRLLGFEPLALERGLDETVAWAKGEGLL